LQESGYRTALRMSGQFSHLPLGIPHAFSFIVSGGVHGLEITFEQFPLVAAVIKPLDS
jgi:hypothetical protein